MKRCMVLVLVLAVLGFVEAQADIYRWTDESGRVHYGERPPHDEARRMDLPASGKSDAASTATDAQRRARQRRLLESYDYEREKKREQQAKDAEQARELAQQCERLKRRWRRFNHPWPIYFKEDDGARRYLDDGERAVELEKMRPAYRKACGEEP